MSAEVNDKKIDVMAFIRQHAERDADAPPGLDSAAEEAGVGLAAVKAMISRISRLPPANTPGKEDGQDEQ